MTKKQNKKQTENGLKVLRKKKKELDLLDLKIEKMRISIMKKDRNLIKRTSELNWFLFSSSYLDIAECGCDKFLDLEEKICEKNENYINRFIIISIVFNIKHALEIIIKFFTKISVKESYKPNHNLNELFKEFKKVEKKITTEKDKKELRKNLESLQLIVYEYFRLKLFQEHVEENCDFLIEDDTNTFLRYPEESKVKFVMDFSSVIEKIESCDIRRTKEDIRKIRKIMFDLQKILSNYKIIDSDF